MNKRRGASLLSVMVFLLFAVMITAQVFFFAKSSVDSVAEQREIMMYRMNLDSLVEEAKNLLRANNEEEDWIQHESLLTQKGIDGNYSYPLTYETLYKGFGTLLTQLRYYDVEEKKWKKTNGIRPDWEENATYYAVIHDLDYGFNPSFNRSIYVDEDDGYGNTNAYKKVFAAMNPPVEDGDAGTYNETTGKWEPDEETGEWKPVRRRYYLIRACARLPENYYGRKLMYQVLVRRDNEDDITYTKTHKVEVISFQEVWF